MPRAAFKDISAGLDTNSPAPLPGAALTARNLLMNRRGRCETRGGILRAHTTRIAAETIWNIFEMVGSTGTVIKLVKSEDDLCTLSLAGGAPSSIEASLATGRADIVEANHLAFIANQRNKNYVSTGATGANNTLTLDKAAPTSALAPASAGTATGMVAGVYRVAYAFYNPTFDWTTPPRAYESVTVTADQAIRCTMPASPGDGFTTMYFYRTKVGEVGPFYWVASYTTFSGTLDLTVIDTDISNNPSTYYESPLHNDDGAIVAANPEESKFACWHKQRLLLYSGATNLLRTFASDATKPTQFYVTSIAQDPAQYHDLDAGQGRVATGVNSWNGAAIYFKNYSITIRNGDIDPASWVWYLAVDGIGCIAPWSRAVAPGLGIFFAGADGIYLLDASFSVRKLSDKPDGGGIGDDYRSFDFSKVEYWWGEWVEAERVYLLGVTTTSASGNNPDRVYAYAADTGAWTTREYGMGLILPTSAGVLTNGSSRPKVYLGTSAGFVYETGYATLTDGPQSGTATGTLTARTATTLTDSGAAFNTTGDGLIGQVVTVRHSATSYESRVITANTATELTVATWTSTPAVGARYFVGSIQSTLTLAPWDGGNPEEKRWLRMNGSWALQTHTTPIRVGFTLDDQATPPTYTGTEQTMGDVRFSEGVNDRAVEAAPHFDCIGTSAPMEMKGVDIEWLPHSSRTPVA